MNINKDIIEIHRDLANFGLMIQDESTNKFKKEHHIETSVYDALSILTAYAICIHKAILSLCNQRWTQISAILIRTIIECAINCLAIVNWKVPEFMAFKYFTYDHLRISKDDYYSEDFRNKALGDVERGVENLENIKAKEKAVEFVSQGKLCTFWFQPEFKFVSKIIEDYGSDDMKYVYKTFSSSLHAGRLGIVIFKDNPEDIGIDACENPIRTKEAILISCKLLLDLLNIRNDYEKLNCDLVYDSIYDRLILLRKNKG